MIYNINEHFPSLGMALLVCTLHYGKMIILFLVCCKIIVIIKVKRRLEDDFICEITQVGFFVFIRHS